MLHDLKVGVLIVGLLIFLLVVPLEVFAEWYADVYTGAVFTNKTDLTIASSLGSTTTYQDLHVNNSWTAGGRGGYCCGTASQEDKKDHPKTQVIGHGTQRAGWLGVGFTIPLPSKSGSAPSSSASDSGNEQSDRKR